jgi:hypothetical protein
MAKSATVARAFRQRRTVANKAEFSAFDEAFAAAPPPRKCASSRSRDPWRQKIPRSGRNYMTLEGGATHA